MCAVIQVIAGAADDKPKIPIPQTARVCVLSNHHPSEITVNAKGELFGVENTDRCDGTAIRFELRGKKILVSSGSRRSETSFAVIRSGRIDLTFTKNGKSERRRYEGALEISPGTDELLAVNEVPFERYVHESAVAELGELVAALNGRARIELVRAMEIVIRSYLVREKRRHEGGNGGYQFCDLTHCVHYPGTVDGGAILSAGEMMYDGKAPVDALFHSTCGGVLAGVDSYWEGKHDGKTFRRGTDVYNDTMLCSQSPHAKWRVRIDRAKLSRIVDKDVSSIECEYKDGRVCALKCRNEYESFRIPISRFLSRAGRMFGWNVIKSNYFEVTAENGGWVFEGKGLGHGVGMCQYGAARLASLGKNAKEILAFYYPGSRLYP